MQHFHTVQFNRTPRRMPPRDVVQEGVGIEKFVVVHAKVLAAINTILLKRPNAGMFIGYRHFVLNMRRRGSVVKMSMDQLERIASDAEIDVETLYIKPEHV